MTEQTTISDRSDLVAGVLLLAIGGLLLLATLDLVEYGRWWRLWPLALVAGGIYDLSKPPSQRKVGNALWLIFMGLWLQISILKLFGLSFRNSWPLILVAVGINMIWSALAGRRRAYSEVTDHER